jgi:hypothetical protein
VLALDATSPGYISQQTSQVHFDINGDGLADNMAWADSHSGVLGIDLNGDRRITDASEFSFKSYLSGAQTDMEGLAAFDTNHDGVLSNDDAQWAQFGVWQDKNGDGQTQDGEFLSLGERGIANINLHTNAQVRFAGATGAEQEVLVAGTGAYTRSDGSTGVLNDAAFTYQSGVDAALEQAHAQAIAQFQSQAQTQTQPQAQVDTQANTQANTPADTPADTHASTHADVMRMALAFNQASTTYVAPTVPEASLGFMSVHDGVYSNGYVDGYVEGYGSAQANGAGSAHQATLTH